MVSVSDHLRNLCIELCSLVLTIGCVETAFCSLFHGILITDLVLYFSSINVLFFSYLLVLGQAVVQFVEALRYKPEGRGFDSRWCHWNFSLTEFFRPHYGPGVDSASNRNEYQEYFLGIEAAGA